ncbi:PEP-CTERM sorting domain-containing protein [Paludibaculum fermentans]|uniref:PEP-CTERM sorting domain-containing protein n=1 Tax=Paludibaculum fermentans TaxID=1473598 RepID=UPI003EB78494
MSNIKYRAARLRVTTAWSRPLLVLAVLAMGAAPGFGAMLYDINSSGSGSSFAGFSGNWGLRFSLTQSIKVGSLGLWDEGANGLAGAHSVGVFTLGGTLLGSATVDNSSQVVSSAATAGRWLFTNVASPFDLAAGSYVLGYYNQAAAMDAFRGNSATTFMSGAGWEGARARAGAVSFFMPDATSGGINQGWFGPNLMTASPAAVPEPATWSLMLLAGALGGAWRARFRRKDQISARN